MTKKVVLFADIGAEISSQWGQAGEITEQEIREMPIDKKTLCVLCSIEQLLRRQANVGQSRRVSINPEPEPHKPIPHHKPRPGQFHKSRCWAWACYFIDQICSIQWPSFLRAALKKELCAAFMADWHESRRYHRNLVLKIIAKPTSKNLQLLRGIGPKKGNVFSGVIARLKDEEAS